MKHPLMTIKLYPHALTAQEVAELYEQEKDEEKMSKQSSKELFEWYARVAEQKLKEKFSHIKTFKDCKNDTEFKNWILLKYIKYYELRCTCDDCMDWEFHIASSHYHHCQLYKFCHAIDRSLEWAEFKTTRRK